LDTGIHFEPLEPRLLLSGSTEGIVAESRLPDGPQSNQSVVEAQNFTFSDEENSTASENLCIFEQDPSSLPAVSDDFDESSLSADEGNQSDPLWVSSNEMPVFDLLEDASKDTEIDVVSHIGDSGSVDLTEGSTPFEAVSSTNISDDTQADEETLAGLDETDSKDTTGITDVLTDPEIVDLDTEEALPGEDITPDSDLTLPEEESEILSDSALPTTNAVSDTADDEARNELVFINDDVADYDQLTEDLLTGAQDGRDITVVTLDSGEDGIEQISSVLSESEDIDAVHFVTHGTDRSVKLGGTWLQDTDLDTYSDAISDWGNALAVDADLIFYGCNLAGGDRGRELLETIGELTDADVAASTDDTGHTLLGGDWELEYKAGSIETGVVYSEGLQQSWTALLGGQAPTTSNKTVTTNEDTTYTLLLSDFNYNDPESDPLDHVQITSLETVGSLELSGVPVTLHQTITAAQITDGELKFVPVGDESGAGYDTFQFRVHDGTNYSAEVSSVTLLNATFGADAEGFTYADDTFGTNDPGNATGTYEAAGGSSGGGLRVYLGPGEEFSVFTTSGGWSKDVSLGAESIVTVSLRYRMLMGEGYEADEYGEVVMEIDGTRYGNDTNDSIFHMIGNGNGGGDEDSGWQYEEIEVTLSAGNHTLTLGAYNNQATFNDEYVEVFLDEVTVSELTFNTMTVDVTADNDAPQLANIEAGALAYTEGDGAVAITAAVTVADVDDTDIDSATVQITGNYQNGEDTLTFVDQNGITGNWVAGTGTLELTGAATKAEYEAALRSVKYSNSSESPSLLNRTVSFTVNDGDTDSVAATRDITVAAENDAPTATDATFSVAEDAANGAVVGTVTATDPDTGDTRTYSITAGNGDGIFAINSATGEITVTDNSNLNYESATSYGLTVQVEDAGGLTDTAAITVNVTGVNESPTADDAALTVAENSANGTVVGTVAATDPDAGDTRTYSITAGNNDGIFAINSATGEITVTDNSNLNYESATSYGLTVKVEDSGGLTDTAAVTVNVTDVNEDPTVSSASFSIDEHSADGSAVGTLTASDPDAGDSLTYSIIAGNDQGLFSIDSSTGKITVNNGTDLDFEVDPTYTLTIRVADSGSPALSETATVTINLNDIFEAVAEKADPEPEPEEPEEAEPDDTTSDTEPEPVEDTGTNNDQTENDPSGGPINDEDPTDNDPDQEDDTESEEETDSENPTDGLPQNLPSDSRDGSNAVSRKKHNPSKRDGKARTSVKNRKESKQVAESNMEEMLLINPQGKPESRREVNLQNEVTTFSAISSEEKISAPAKAIISNRTMQRELDSINNQIDEAAKRLESRGKLIAGTAMGVSAALMGGYALWAFRGISLMASSFASLPVWQFFDPLPVLSDWEGKSQTAKVSGKNDDENIDEEEKELQKIFDK